ncbi:MAG: tetratricopeptide repeat protein, partial [Chloroflexota bacterium]
VELQYDVYANLEATVDNIDLRQIEAREHFIVILAPEVINTALNPDSRIYREFKTAVESQRNIIALTPKDFEMSATPAPTDPILKAIMTTPRVRVNTGHINQLASHLEANFFQQAPRSMTIPSPTADADEVAKRQKRARTYAREATIRLNTEKRFLGAVSKIRQGHYEEALHDLDMVIAENNKNENAYLQRGRVLRRMGRTTAALRDYEQATNLSPKMVAAHIGRGELLLETERYQQAIAAFEAALEAQEKSAPALAGKALTLFVSGQPDKARELWAKLIHRDANYADAEWTAGVFDWPESLQKQAASLLETMK